MSDFESLLGVRLQKLLPVKQMEIWYSTGFILLCTMSQNFLSWILMWLKPDKSNMSSPILMYNQVSESSCPGCPVSTLAGLNLWLTINLREPKTLQRVASRAWQRWRKQLSPRFVSQPTVWPCRRALICLHTLPPKNSLISNGLILCSQYGLHMFSLIAFQSYSIEQGQDYKMSFSSKKKKRC